MLTFSISYYRLFGFNGGKLRMDERLDLSMSDPDLVPLIVQVRHSFEFSSCSLLALLQQFIIHSLVRLLMLISKLQPLVDFST